jgi:hypothetical protein
MPSDSANPPGRSPLPTADRLRTARDNNAWAKNASNGLIFGGATIGLGLILSNLAVARDVYVALELLYAALFFAVALFSWRATIKGYSNALSASALISGTLTLSIALNAALSRHQPPGYWPIKPHRTGWWVLVGIALGAALIGAIHRRAADKRLEDIKQMEELVTGIQELRAESERYKRRDAGRKKVGDEDGDETPGQHN